MGKFTAIFCDISFLIKGIAVEHVKNWHKNHKTPGEIGAIFHLFMSDDISYYGATTKSHMKSVHGYVR